MLLAVGEIKKKRQQQCCFLFFFIFLISLGRASKELRLFGCFAPIGFRLAKGRQEQSMKREKGLGLRLRSNAFRVV